MNLIYTVSMKTNKSRRKINATGYNVAENKSLSIGKVMEYEDVVDMLKKDRRKGQIPSVNSSSDFF
ncbi:hypothetical protein KIN20_025482 [Parelaphostrongylus tenuis]|uniref:Uncharacterized protein n=1 Tax=Parelaphostrongylus tenuis TaxID=148309 RepID=A0AAD5MVA4_PARTN|nr:hypothetical protein KIN20_025482 [Parelaphostrongylus tenuis]